MALLDGQRRTARTRAHRTLRIITNISLPPCFVNFAGCNLICTALHKTFHRLFEEHVPEGEQPHIDHLTTQVDNCVSENKNNILLGYLGSLVGRGIIGSVTVQFMPVGHTHIKIDQAFSR